MDAREWKSAVHMYRNAEQWDDALRVAKACGGPNAAKQVAFARAVALGGEAGAQYLSRQGLVDQAIEYAVDSANFEMAFELAKSASRAKEQEVHLKYAMFLEDEGEFQVSPCDIEVEPSRHKGAVRRRVHISTSAAVALGPDHQALPPLGASIELVPVEVRRSGLERMPRSHFHSHCSRRASQRAEDHFVKAGKPREAIDMWLHQQEFDAAMRVAEGHDAASIRDIQVSARGHLLSGFASLALSFRLD